MIDSLELEPTEKECGMWFKQEFRPTRRGPVGREFMPGNHDPYLKNIYAPLASRFGVEIEKMRIGILRGRSAPLRIPPPKRVPGADLTLTSPASRSLGIPRILKQIYLINIG